jgi:hypothetical protein
MTRIETSIISGTITKEFTITNGLSRIIAMAATIADSSAISKEHIGSGAITTTTIVIVTMTMTMITTGTKQGRESATGLVPLRAPWGVQRAASQYSCEGADTDQRGISRVRRIHLCDS